jgi:hypothetical protein
VSLNAASNAFRESNADFQHAVYAPWVRERGVLTADEIEAASPGHARLLPQDAPLS